MKKSALVLSEQRKRENIKTGKREELGNAKNRW